MVTCLRVPVTRGHHLQVTCPVRENFDLKLLLNQWSQHSRLTICHNNHFPYRDDFINQPEVFLSRIRHQKGLLSFMITSDNLYVGAAHNAWLIFDQHVKAKLMMKAPVF